MEKNTKININDLFEREIDIFNTSYESLNERKKILGKYSSYFQKYLDIINTYYMGLTELKTSFSESFFSKNEYEISNPINKISNLFLSFIDNHLSNMLQFLANTQSIIFSLNQTINNTKDILSKTEEKNKEIFDNIKIMNDKYYNDYCLMINSFENLEKKIINKYIKNKFTHDKGNNLEIAGNDNENEVKKCVSISKKLENSFCSFKKDEIKKYIYEYNDNMELVMKNNKLYIKAIQNSIINVMNSFNQYFYNSFNFINNELREHKGELSNINHNEDELDYKINEKETNTIIFNIFNSKKYNIKLLNDDAIINDEIDKNDEKAHSRKKGKIYLSEEDKYNIINEIYDYNFKCISKEEFNLDIEKEKLKVNELSKKLLSYDKVRDIKESISDEEVKTLYNLLKIKKSDENIIYFIKHLYQFRSEGKLEMPERVFNIINNILENCLKEIFDEKNKYIKLISSIAMISCTFYIIKNREKYYFKENLKGNEIFTSMEFWNNYTIMLIEEDFKKSENDSKNNYEEIYKKKINAILMAKILPVAVTMKKFGIDSDTIYKNFDVLIDKYQMDEKSKQLLLSLINQQE